MATRLYFHSALYDRAYFGGSYKQGATATTTYTLWQAPDGTAVFVGRFDADIVGTPGTVRWSTDPNLNDWNQATIGTSTPFPATFYTEVYYANGIWLLGDDIGHIYSSTDGKQWTLRYTDANARFVERIRYGNGLFVAAGDAVTGQPGLVATSTDGITWTPRSVTVTGSNNVSIAYSPTLNRWVIVGGSGNTYYATDPTGAWTNVVQGASAWYSVAWCPTTSQFVMGGLNGILATSPTGITWTNQTSGVTGSLWFVDELSTGIILVVGSASTRIQSTNGTSWTSWETPPDQVNTLYGFHECTVGGIPSVVLLGDVGFLQSGKLTFSTQTWTILGYTDIDFPSLITYSATSSYDATSPYLRLMDSTIGTGQQTILNISSAINTQQSVPLAMFASYPLDSAQTVGSIAGVTLNTAQKGSSNAAQFRVTSMLLYVWRPSTGIQVGTLVNGPDVLLGGAAGSTAETVQHLTSIGTGSISAKAGDVIICEIWGTWTQSMATAYDVNFYYDGTTVNTTQGATVANHASFIEFPENLTFSTTPVSGVQSRSFFAFF